jgi:hypothetical protein
MIDRGRVHALAGESAGLDRLDRLLAAYRADRARMTAEASRIHAALRHAAGRVDRTDATAIAADWLEVLADWRATVAARYAEHLAQIEKQRAIVAARPTGRLNRKVDRRRRVDCALADADLAEIRGTLAALEQTERELRERVPVPLPGAGDFGSVIDATP